MAERIEQYLDEVGAHVRWKRVRPALTQELRTHLEEQAEAYRAEGLPAAEAEAEAVRQMGDAEQIGLALDAVHRPKRQTAILSLAGDLHPARRDLSHPEPGLPEAVHAGRAGADGRAAPRRVLF